MIEGGGYHKIGRSLDLPERIKWFELHLPFPIRLVDYIGVPGHRAVETALHRHYVQSRTNGEWFTLSTEQVAEFTRVVEQFSEYSAASCTHRTRDDAINAARNYESYSYIARVNRRYVCFPTSVPYEEVETLHGNTLSIVGVVAGEEYRSFSGK